MKIKRNYSPEESAGGGAASVEKDDFFGDMDFSKVEITKNDENDSSDESEEEQADEPKKEQPKKPVVKKKKEEESSSDESTDNADENTGENEGENTETEEADENTEEGGEETLPLPEDEVTPDPELTWEDLGKNFELPEVDASLTGQDRFEAQLKAKSEADYQRGKQDAEKLDLQQLAPEEQLFAKALRGGMKMKDVMLPVNDLHKAAMQPDKDVLMAYHTLVLKMDQEVAEDQVNIMMENGSSVVKAAEIREALYAKADEVLNSKVGEFSKIYEAEQARIKEETERENQRVKAEISSRTEFMGSKMTEAHHKVLMQKWESGHYKNSFKNDEKSVVDFILWKEFGKTREAEMKKAAKRDAKTDTFRKLSNSSSTPGGSKNSGTEKKADDWSDWEIKGQEKVEVERGR